MTHITWWTFGFEDVAVVNKVINQLLNKAHPVVNPSNTENTNAKQFLAKTKSNHHVQGAHKMAAVILVRDGGKKKNISWGKPKQGSQTIRWTNGFNMCAL